VFFSRGILVLALLLFCTRPVAAAEPNEAADVAELFARMRANLARIASIEHTWGSSRKLYVDGVLKDSSEREVTFAYAAGKYRSQLLVKHPGKALFSRDYAYDGLRYQEFYADTEDLVRKSKPARSAYGGMQPFFHHYAMIVKVSSPYTVECCLDEAAWKSVAAGAVLEGSKEVDGHPCQVVRITFPHRDGENVRRIHAATDLEYLPLLIEAQGGGLDFTFRLSNLESFPTPAGRVVIPLNTAGEETYGANRVVHQWWINADGLKVNQAIAPERFTIPLELAKRVLDVD
jgi:hypothetical protein